MIGGYTFDDLIECATGVFSATILFVALKSGDHGPFLNVNIMLLITALWTYLVYQSFVYKNHTNNTKFIINIIITLTISIFLTMAFNLATWNEILQNKIIGSPVVIIYILGLPIGALFEKMNVRHIFSSHYVQKKY